jgi:hypothetical protein
MARYTVLLYYPGQLGEDERETLEARLSALERAFHALDLFTDVAGAASPLQRKSLEWNALETMIKIRNRIVHPRFSQDVFITDEELVAIESAANVVADLCSESFRRAGSALLKSHDAIQKGLESRDSD